MMRICLLLASVCFAGPGATATWFCMAALSATSGGNQMPDSPTVFELDLETTGTFRASGELRNGGEITGFDWAGHWTEFDNGLALIGERSSRFADLSEMRALSTLVREDVLILNLTQTPPWSQTVRCLPYDLG